jgi:hypothetical protein
VGLLRTVRGRVRQDRVRGGILHKLKIPSAGPTLLIFILDVLGTICVVTAVEPNLILLFVPPITIIGPADVLLPLVPIHKTPAPVVIIFTASVGDTLLKVLVVIPPRKRLNLCCRVCDSFS